MVLTETLPCVAALQMFPPLQDGWTHYRIRVYNRTHYPRSTVASRPSPVSGGDSEEYGAFPLLVFNFLQGSRTGRQSALGKYASFHRSFAISSRPPWYLNCLDKAGNSV